MKSSPGTTNEKAGACSRKNSRLGVKRKHLPDFAIIYISDLCKSQIPFPHIETYNKTPASCVCCTLREALKADPLGPNRATGT